MKTASRARSEVSLVHTPPTNGFDDSVTEPTHDPVLDGLVTVAAQALRCPIARISVVTRRGPQVLAFEGPGLGDSQDSFAFCAHTVLDDALLEIPDASLDDRFSGNPLVAGRPGLRFYAGVRIGQVGHRLGTLCVIDREPRTLSADERATLGHLARAAERCLAASERPARRPRAAARGTAPGSAGADDAAEAAQQQEWLRTLSAAVDQSSESILVTDALGRIQYVNDATEVNTGYARSDLLGRNPRMLKSGRTPASVYAELWQAITAGRTWRGVLYNRRRDGSPLIESAAISPVRAPDGHVTHYVAVKQDITENRDLRAELENYRTHLDALVRRRTEAVERARAEAEAANTAKSAFLAAMSHEIRTPMNGVIGVIELLERSSLTPDQKELTDTARESASVLLALIEDILDFSKIEAGRLELEEAPLDPAHLLEAACEALQSVAHARNVEVHVHADPALPAQVMGDAVRVRQIITNLLGNAIKFSAKTPHARVSVRLAPAGDGPVPALKLSVVDNGIGMSEEVLSRLFRPFEQAERSTTRQFGGTGLGLTICHRLVTAMGGTITVTSSSGAGSRFEVTLPLTAVPGAPAAPPAQDLTGLACALVMDEVEWAQDFASVLRAAGAQVAAEAAPGGPSGAGAVWIVEADRADGIVPPGAGRVLLRRGERRTPREEAPGRVSLDVPGVRRDALIGAVAMAAGRGMPNLAVAAEAIGPSGAPALRVLVAEDNETNRKVLRRQLRLLGIAAELAPDGAAALAMWRRSERPFDLLLTDLHMPELDGYGLVAAIRAEEGPGHLPIVALTANALRGEADQCKAAGMDDYLSKPVQLDRLRATILRWTLNRSTAGRDIAEAAAPGRRARHAEFDAHALERLVGNDPVLLAQLRQEYLAASTDDLAALKAAVEHEDWRAAGGVAHRCKSGSRSVGALALGQLLEEIELACQQSRPDDVRSLATELDACFEAARRRLLPGAAGSGDDEPSDPARDASDASGGNDERRVLLVDDDELMLRHTSLLMRSLRRVGIETFPSAASLLERLPGIEGRTSLAMIDLNMPGMDGIELIRHLAERNYDGAIALVSGADRRVLETAARLAQARGLHVLGHLHKPLSADALDALLAGWDELPAAPPGHAVAHETPHEIRRAIEGNELRVVYQPQIDLRTGALVGVEALVRWQHPQRGLLMPGCFVPVAEEHGLVEPLTRRVLDMALAQARAWRDEHGLRVRIAVNVSMDNLLRLDFAEYVVARLAFHGIAPQDLVLEVTETRLMKDLRAPLDILTRLRLRGISLSIDDFGTGHSSLAQLRDLPFDELKIDRSFVHGGRDDATRRAILTGSVDMAQQLGMRIVAEGVEDAADWALVRQAVCTEAQGYHLSRPMPGEDLPRWLADWPKRRDHLLARAAA